MNYLKHSLLIVFLLQGSVNLFSQLTITASQTIGCDSISIDFAINPMSDTITSITWDFDDGVILSGDSIPTHIYSSPGEYNVSVLINSVNTLTLSTAIKVYLSPDARFGYNDSLELGSYSFVFLNVAQADDSYTYTYDWTFPDNETADTRGVVHTFDEAGTYVVGLIVKNEFGCADTMARNVNVQDLLIAPNVFTPNEDGFNDYFEVRTNGVNRYEFLVYSRAGMLVYKSETATIIWDGRSLSGNILRSGVYYYIIRQIDGDALTKQTGFVQIL